MIIMAFGVESLDFYTGGQLFHSTVVGCMDENNLNYDPAATINDGDRCGGCIEGYTRLGDPAFVYMDVVLTSRKGVGISDRITETSRAI